MIETIRHTIVVFESYLGGGMLPVMGFACILYLWLLEDKREIRIILAGLSLLLLVIYFCPLLAWPAIHYFLDKGVYYRLLWLLPLALVSAYSLVRIIAHLDERRKRIATIVLMCILMAHGGKFVYFNPLMSPSENLYQLPQSVIDVADIMHVEGRDVKAVVPGEMLQFIRQYDSSILLAYGREALVEGWSSNPLYEAMEAERVRTYAITDLSRQQGVEYIVLRKGTVTVGTKPIDKYEFSYLTSAGDYDIFIFDRASFAPEKLALYEGSREAGYKPVYIPND